MLLEFAKSEIAIRKSERNEPDATLVGRRDSPAADRPEAAQAPPTLSMRPINFERLKTIIALRFDVVQAGSKPLVAPYRLIVFWTNRPGNAQAHIRIFII